MKKPTSGDVVRLILANAYAAGLIALALLLIDWIVIFIWIAFLILWLCMVLAEGYRYSLQLIWFGFASWVTLSVGLMMSGAESGWWVIGSLVVAFALLSYSFLKFEREPSVELVREDALERRKRLSVEMVILGVVFLLMGVLSAIPLDDGRVHAVPTIFLGAITLWVALILRAFSLE